jgi:general nucleoside transport system permease protein
MGLMAGGWLFDIVAAQAFWIAVSRIAMPLTFGTLGALLCERSGVLNLGIEGIMVAGAFSGWYAVYCGLDLWSGLVVAMLVGAAFGLLHAVLTVPLGLSQHVTGLGITLLASNLSFFAYRVLLPNTTTPPAIVPFQPLKLLPQLPVVGDFLTAQTAPMLLAPVAVLLMEYMLTRTPLGLAIRTAGENPAALEAQGIGVGLIRTGAVVFGSALMGLAGATLTLSAFNAFYFNMVNGRGWICVALTVFASWQPWKAFLGTLLFAFFDALQLRLQQSGAAPFGIEIPYQIYLMIPYLLSILALVLVARRAVYPRALMQPYRRGER